MDGGNGGEVKAQKRTEIDADRRKSSTETVESGGSVSGTDVDSACSVVAKLFRSAAGGSVTTADRPRPATGVERGNIVSRSHHFVGSKKQPSFYADIGYVRPHHSRANINISQQAVGKDENSGFAKGGNLPVVESSKSDTELLISQDEGEWISDASLTMLAGLMAKAVTVATADMTVHQSLSSDPVVAHLNNSSSKTYQSTGGGPTWRGQRSSRHVALRQRSANAIGGETEAQVMESKSSLRGMLERIRHLRTHLTSSSDESRNQDDTTTTSSSSEDSCGKHCLTSKIPCKKVKKKRKSTGGNDDSEKSSSEKGSVSGMEVDKSTHGANDGLPKSTQPDVLKEIEIRTGQAGSDAASVKSIQEGQLSDRSFERVTEEWNKNSVASQHSASSIEFLPGLHEYDESVHGEETVSSEIVASGAKPKQQKVAEFDNQGAVDREKKLHITQHSSDPTIIRHEDADEKSHPEITLKAVKERCRILSEQIGEAVLPGVSIDEKIRLAVLGSLSYAAMGGEHQDQGRRVASAPGPLENIMAQHLAEEFVKNQQAESGISSFEGPYYEEESSSNHNQATVQANQEQSLRNDNGKMTPSYVSNHVEKSTSSSESSQDDYVQQMQEAQKLLNSQHSNASQTFPLPKPTSNSNYPQTAASFQEPSQDPDTKLFANDYTKTLPAVPGASVGFGSPSAVSSGYGSSVQARIAELDTNLANDEALPKPHRVGSPMEEESVRRKELSYILKMLQRDSADKDSTVSSGRSSPSLLEAAVGYLYWSRHSAEELLRKPQQHQKVVMEDTLETKNLELDLPPHSGFRANNTLEELKAELELKVKEIDSALTKNKESAETYEAYGQIKKDSSTNTGSEDTDASTSSASSSASSSSSRKATRLEPPIYVPDTKATEDKATHYCSSSSSEDDRPPSSFHYNASVAVMSPGGALGSGTLLEECETARRVRQEMGERIAELEREKQDMAAQMKDQRLAAVQLEAHILSQLTTLTKDYQNLMARDQKHQQLSKDLKQKLDQKQKELEQAQATIAATDEATSSNQLQSKLDTLSFESKERIHQLNVQLTAAEQQNQCLENRLCQEAVRQQSLKEDALKNERELTRERDALVDELEQERSKHAMLEAQLMGQERDLQHMVSAVQDLRTENRSQAEEVRGLRHALEASHHSQLEAEQELERANEKLDARREQWNRQKQQMADSLSEAKATVEKSQLHLKSITHTNQTLLNTQAQLRQDYQAVSGQLHKEHLAKESTSRDLERIRDELDVERKTRLEQVNSQLSQWQQNLQTNTVKLSEALRNKIGQQQRELDQLRATNTKLATNLPVQYDARQSHPNHRPQQEPSNDYLGHDRPTTSSAHCTNVNTEGALCSNAQRDCPCCHHYHKLT